MRGVGPHQIRQRSDKFININIGSDRIGRNVRVGVSEPVIRKTGRIKIVGKRTYRLQIREQGRVHVSVRNQPFAFGAVAQPMRIDIHVPASVVHVHRGIDTLDVMNIRFGSGAFVDTNLVVGHERWHAGDTPLGFAVRPMRPQRNQIRKFVNFSLTGKRKVGYQGNPFLSAQQVNRFVYPGSPSTHRIGSVRTINGGVF